MPFRFRLDAFRELLPGTFCIVGACTAIDEGRFIACITLRQALPQCRGARMGCEEDVTRQMFEYGKADPPTSLLYELLFRASLGHHMIDS
jgi:hypothetical protein